MLDSNEPIEIEITGLGHVKMSKKPNPTPPSLENTKTFHPVNGKDFKGPLKPDAAHGLNFIFLSIMESLCL